MLQRASIIFATALGFFAAPAMAGAQDEADEALISEALDAINAGDFEQAAAKAQEVISRFEATRRPNARYACSSGPGDTRPSRRHHDHHSITRAMHRPFPQGICPHRPRPPR